MKTLRKYINALPYPVNLQIVITDDLTAVKLDGKNREGLSDASGCVVFVDTDFWIVLKRDSIQHDIIAHECFHATHFILDACGVKFKVSDKHEAFSYFNGYLNKQVYGQLKKWRIRVK